MKVLKIAAIVIGAAVLIGTGIGLALGAPLGVSFASVTATLGAGVISSSLAATIGLAALAIDASMLAGALFPRNSDGGNPTRLKRAEVS